MDAYAATLVVLWTQYMDWLLVSSDGRCADDRLPACDTIGGGYWQGLIIHLAPGYWRTRGHRTDDTRFNRMNPIGNYNTVRTVMNVSVRESTVPAV
jgi:hypothetical protein